MLLSDTTVEAVQAAVPEWLALVFAAVTMIGEPWLVVFGLALVYWYGNEQQRAGLYAGVLGGVALVLVLKAAFGLPRPTVGPPVPTDSVPTAVQPVYEQAVKQEGSGFPSGHTAIATLLWGSVGIVATGIRRSVRAVAIGSIVLLVAVSRVIIGVHYPVDVVAGALLGVAVLAAVVVLCRSSHGVLSTIMMPAIVTALAAVVVYGPVVETFAVVGALVGGALGFALVSAPAATLRRDVRFGFVGTVGLGSVGIASVAGTVAGHSVLRSVGQVDIALAPSVVAVGTIALGAWIFTWPTLAARWQQSAWRVR